MEEEEEEGEIEQQNEREEIITAEKPVEQDNVDKDSIADEEEPEAVEKIILEVVSKQLQEQEETRGDDEARIKTIGNEEEAAEEVGETQPGSSKKPKHSPMQAPRSKLTIPQPFSLATEKRSRERRASVDFSSVNKKKPVQAVDFIEAQAKRLHKSASLNLRAKTPTSNARDKVKENSDRKVSGVEPRNFSRSKVATTESADKKTELKREQTKHKHQVTEAESQNFGFLSKRQPAEDASKKTRLRKNSTFKASPLPNSNGAKHLQPKPDDKRQAATTNPKSAPPCRAVGKSAATADSGNEKTQDKCKNSSVSRTVSSSAKDTLSKLFKTTRRASAAPEETTKPVVSKS